MDFQCVYVCARSFLSVYLQFRGLATS
jgi:hypothetical protein